MQGIPIDRVDNHSLRAGAGGLNALLLAGYSERDIKKWSVER